MAQVNTYPLRISKQLMEKLKVIAKENGRSVNKEIEFIVKETIASYEKQNGKIIIFDFSQ